MCASTLTYNRCRVPECENETDTEYIPSWIDNTMKFDDVQCNRYTLTEEAQKIKPKGNLTCPKTWFDKKHAMKCNKEDLVYEYDDNTIMHEVRFMEIIMHEVRYNNNNNNNNNINRK